MTCYHGQKLIVIYSWSRDVDDILPISKPSLLAVEFLMVFWRRNCPIFKSPVGEHLLCVAGDVRGGNNPPDSVNPFAFLDFFNIAPQLLHSREVCPVPLAFHNDKVAFVVKPKDVNKPMLCLFFPADGKEIQPDQFWIGIDHVRHVFFAPSDDDTLAVLEGMGRKKEHLFDGNLHKIFVCCMGRRDDDHLFVSYDVMHRILSHVIDRCIPRILMDEECLIWLYHT